MPRSASTAEAARASPMKIADNTSAPSSWRYALALTSTTEGPTPLTDRLIKPLVIKRAFKRVQLLPEVFGVGGRDARIEGFLVAPAFEQGEMVRAIVLLEHVEPQV